MSFNTGFKEVFRLFDKNSDSSISTEEAAKVLTLVGEIEENSNMTGDEFQGLFRGYNSEGKFCTSPYKCSEIRKC